MKLYFIYLDIMIYQELPLFIPNDKEFFEFKDNKVYKLYALTEDKKKCLEFIRTRASDKFIVKKKKIPKEGIDSKFKVFTLDYMEYNMESLEVYILSTEIEKRVSSRDWHNEIFKDVNFKVKDIKTLELFKDKYLKALAELQLMDNIIIVNNSWEHFNYDSVPESIIYEASTFLNRYNIYLSLEMYPNTLNIFIHFFSKTFK